MSLLAFTAHLPLHSQTTSVAIVGPATGVQSQPMTFTLMSGTQQLKPDSWRQLYNPDRYQGNEYVSSFDLQLEPNADGSLTATAQYPGRYKLAAVQDGQQYTAAVRVPPTKPPVKMKVLSFLPNSLLDRVHAANQIALASHIGADWAFVGASLCMDLNSPGTYTYTDQPGGWCNANPLSDVAWLIDELHANGFKVIVQPSIYATYQGIVDQLQLFLPGAIGAYSKIDLSQVPALFNAWSQMAVDLATLIGQHQAEMFLPGTHDTVVDSTTNTLWNATAATMLPNIRSVYKGQVWWGPIQQCGDPFPFNYSLVDGIWFSGLLVSASSPPCTFLSPPGLNNIHAEQMLSFIRADRAAGSGFSVGQKQGLPMLWMDFNPFPIDGMNYVGSHWAGLAGIAHGIASDTVPTDPNLRDFQEPVDYQDAIMQAGVVEGGFQAVAVDSVYLVGPGFLNILEQPAVLASLTNWYGGDWNYYAPCFSDPAPDVLFPRLPLNCPLTLLPNKNAQINLFDDLSLVNDSTSTVTPYFRFPGGTQGKIQFGDPSWTDYDASVSVRLAQNGSRFALGIRTQVVPNYTEYSVNIGAGLVQIDKITYSSSSTNGQLHTIVAQQSLPGTFDPAHWYQVEVSAVGNQFAVTVDGKILIQYTDTLSPILNGSFIFLAAGCCETDFGNILVRSLSAQAPTVVSAASYSSGAVSPGEIVTLKGSPLGPQNAVTADGTKSFPMTLGGTQVLFNGVPSPLIYSQAQQVNAVVPWELTGTMATVRVTYPGASLTPATVPVAGSATTLFTLGGDGFGAGAILNQDYSVNSPANPAPAGGVVLRWSGLFGQNFGRS